MNPSTQSLIDNLFFTTVRLESDTGRATGFVVDVGDRAGPAGRHFVVTARHAVEGTDTLTLHFIAEVDGGPHLGHSHEATITNLADVWTAHHDEDMDVAVIPLDQVLDAIDAPVFVQVIPIATLYDPLHDEPLDAIEDVVFLGYPNGLYDQMNLTPLARRGSTATPPMLDYGHRPVFLVDASVFPGSSGSPVFLLGDRGARRADQVTPEQARLLGIIGQAKAKPVGTSAVGADAGDGLLEMIDLGVVYKASTIAELLDRASQP